MTPIKNESTNQINCEPQLIFDLRQLDSIVALATITVPSSIVDAVFMQASLSQKNHTQAYGFHKGQVPLEYIAQNFKSNLAEHLKEFIFKYFVVGFLFDQIRTKKLLVVGQPRFMDMHVYPGQDARFIFELSLFEPLIIQEWKYLPFKAPKRKNYKDLDRQVESFIEEEKEFLKNSALTALEIGDWINFDVALIDANNNPIAGFYSLNLWMRLGDEEADSSFHELFIGKHLGDSFSTANPALQEYFSDQFDTHYVFKITIKDILKNRFFCLEHFKRYFKLKTNKDLYQKLIEVFSYRNDISLRRSIAEESLKLLFSKHRFTIPSYLILRQQQVVLNNVRNNPDYHVYRVQSDFQERIKQLAEKQVRETIFLDQLAYQEDIEVVPGDIKSYLNLTNRPRMKDFLYFDAPSTKSNGQETPLIDQELKRFYLREKALNHIIYHLTKK